MARAPFSTMTSERTKVAAGFSDATNNRCSGRSMVEPAAMRITAPSPIKAVLSATATSLAGASLPRCCMRTGSLSANASASEPTVSPFSKFARSDNSGTNAPSTKTRRRVSTSPRIAPAFLARVLAAASGGAASGFASRISARRSVYFQSSTRRCGRPSLANRPKAGLALHGDRVIAGQRAARARETAAPARFPPRS